MAMVINQTTGKPVYTDPKTAPARTLNRILPDLRPQLVGVEPCQGINLLYIPPTLPQLHGVIAALRR